jgi:leader peptidase (prepilin peptidase)/N-methyltransferase
MEDPFLVQIIISIIAGLIFGSFFNVLIYRLPKGESILWPGSRCTHCGRPVRFMENIPVFSYLFLGGRCAGCKKKISLQYPLVEFFTACLALIIWYYIVTPFTLTHHPWWEYLFLGLQIASFLILIPISVIDYHHYIIPDSLTLGGLTIGIAFSFIPGNITPLQSFLGILVGGGSLYLLGFFGELIFKKEAMGGGDIKLMAFIGAVWGWEIAGLSIIFGALFGAIIGVLFMIIRILPKNHQIPFGPFLGLGFWLTVLYGKEIVLAYFRFVNGLM